MNIAVYIKILIKGTVELLNSELTMKGQSSLVDTISSGQKLFFYTIELLSKGQPPVMDTLKSSQGCPLQRSSTVHLFPWFMLMISCHGCEIAGRDHSSSGGGATAEGGGAVSGAPGHRGEPSRKRGEMH